MSKNLIYTICSPRYLPVLAESIGSVSNYASRHGVDFVVMNNPDTIENPLKNKRRHFGNKFTSFSRVSSSYSKVLYLDCDVYVKPDAPNIFDESINDFGGCLGLDNEYTETVTPTVISEFPLFDFNCRLNGGMFIGDYDALRFIMDKAAEMWRVKSKVKRKHYFTDEIYLAEILRTYFPHFTRLSSDWNTNFKNKNEQTNFVHCMARTVENKANQLRSLA